MSEANCYATKAVRLPNPIKDTRFMPLVDGRTSFRSCQLN